MTARLLHKSGLAEFLARIGEERDVFAPVNRGGKAVWTASPDPSAILYDFVNTQMSPKEFFLPQTECLSAFKNAPGAQDGMIQRASKPLDKPRLLLFMRPCDGKSLALLDGIFSRDAISTDPYWFDKRGKTLVVGLACNHPCPTCFCDRVGCGPHSSDGQDVLAVDLGDRLLLTSRTGRGKTFLAALPEAPESDLEAAKAQAAGLAQAASARLASFTSSDLEPGRIQTKDLNNLYRQRFWKNVGSTCLSCGVCTFTCPTCHCFDIQDETKGVKGRRVRNWDFCTSGLFTKHASGHNPRPQKFERLRQRFLHKLKYIPENRNGAVGCVGCGRCVRLCPSNIDIREVIRLCQNAPEATRV